MPLITDVDRLKRYLGVSGSTYDDLLDDLIAQVDAKAKHIMGGRVIPQTTHTNARLDGSGCDQLILPHYPIVSVADLRTSQDYDFANATALVQGEDFEIDADNGMLICMTGVWPEGRLNVRATYVGGFSSVPEDLIEAASICVAEEFTRSTQLASGQSQSELASENLGGGARSESYRSDMDDRWGIPRRALATLQRYRNRWG